MKLPPYNDRIALLLRNHYQTEESDAGLRSPSLEGSPKGSSSPDAAAIARVSSKRQDGHGRCREALSKLAPNERTVLTLAYGLHLRSREIDDSSKRKAPKKSERDWRVVLRETYGIGDLAGIVLLHHPIDFLLSEAAKSRRERILSDSVYALHEARRAFAAVYVPPNGEERLDAPQKRNRGRPKVDDGVRFRVLGGSHGREIGR